MHSLAMFQTVHKICSSVGGTFATASSPLE